VPAPGPRRRRTGAVVAAVAGGVVTVDEVGAVSYSAP
jgi:hypothetical protein